VQSVQSTCLESGNGIGGAERKVEPRQVLVAHLGLCRSLEHTSTDEKNAIHVKKNLVSTFREEEKNNLNLVDTQSGLLRSMLGDTRSTYEWLIDCPGIALVIQVF
jgi:hypothetical protein